MQSEGGEAGRSSRCPVCGLPFEVRAKKGTPTLHYDITLWDRLCKSPALGGPSLCLAYAFASAGPTVDPATGHGDPAIKPAA